MGEIMKEYFKHYWKWLCISLVLPILLLLLMIFLNTDTFETILAVLIIVLGIIVVISIVLALIKRNRKFTTIFLTTFLSCLLVIAYSMTIAPQYYSPDSELSVNIFQRHRLNKASKQLKQIRSAIKDPDNISKTKTARSNLKQLKKEILKTSNSKSTNEDMKYTYTDLSNSLDGKKPLTSNNINLFILSVDYCAGVLKEHYTDKQIKKDGGKFIGHFSKVSGGEF